MQSKGAKLDISTKFHAFHCLSVAMSVDGVESGYMESLERTNTLQGIIRPEPVFSYFSRVRSVLLFNEDKDEGRKKKQQEFHTAILRCLFRMHSQLA